ncbi:MAG TPA: discoidin domain-containing protein [Streptosporangiaceae bacterium]|nr:discoidin domain-containing protein [Streptosporangiaceae bacterium]
MSTYTSEPGTLLAGRYRLVDQTSMGTGWVFWKATDEPLARFVTVLTFASGFPRITEVITAARAASRLGDPRFSQVFDVEDVSELAYVVLEWVAGESLLDMLADGPLDAPNAVSLLREAAQAIAVAHAGGLAHLRLNPACLHWTRGSGVKITGLGIDAVLAGVTPDTGGAENGQSVEDGSGDGHSPELTDTQDLARLLYAALTGYWPGSVEPAGSGDAAEPADPQGADSGARAGLPAAPEADGVPCTPRQVSAAVPANIDALTCQALFQRPSRHGPAISTPAMLAEALANVASPDPLPMPAAATASLRAPADHGYQPNGPTNPFPEAGPATRRRSGAPYRRPPPDRSSTRAVIISAVVVIVLVAAGVVGWALNHHGSPPGSAPPTQSPSSSSPPPAAALVVLTPVSANSFDALGNDGGNEDGGGAKNAIDNSASTFWHTDYYFTYPNLGNLKKGTGLILDMGKQVRLSQVVVQFGASCCTDVEIEIGNDNNPVPSALNSFTKVASSTTAHGSTTFDVSSTTTGRYVLIWITRLPPLAGTGNQYEAQIYNVVVHGSAASQSG